MTTDDAILAIDDPDDGDSEPTDFALPDDDTPPIMRKLIPIDPFDGGFDLYGIDEEYL